MYIFRSALIDLKGVAYLADWIRNFRRAVQMGGDDAAAILTALYKNICRLVAHV